jgi:hypothetical protein
MSPFGALVLLFGDDHVRVRHPGAITTVINAAQLVTSAVKPSDNAG